MATPYTDLDAVIAQAEADLKGARKAMRQVAPSVPDTAPAQTALGLAYMTLEQPRDAARAFKRAVDLDPEDTLARYQLGAYQTDVGLLPQGEENLRVAAAAEPENAEYQAALGFNFYKADRQPEAIAAFEIAVAAGSEDDDVFASLGYLYYFGERLDDARQAFGRASELNPERGEVNNNRGYLHILLGDLPAAQTDLTACLLKDEDFQRARYNLALATWLQGDHAAAEELYRSARQHDHGEEELKQHLDDFDEVMAHYPQDNSLKDLKIQLAVTRKAGRR